METMVEKPKLIIEEMGMKENTEIKNPPATA